MKKTVPLNDEWLFCVGFEKDFLDPEFDFSGFVPVSLPHNAPLARGDSGESVYTYARGIEPDERYGDSRLELCFDGVSSYAEVYINGIFVASHRGDAPFVVDISAPVKIGQMNRIIVKADSSLRKDVPVSSGAGPAVSGGIHREVFLKAASGAEISDVFVTSNFADGQSGECDLALDVTLGDFYPDSVLSACIYDGEGNAVCTLSPKAVLAKSVCLSGRAVGIKRWSLGDPVLYTAHVTLVCRSLLADEQFVSFGFRSAEFKRDGFYLNGEKVKLIGLNRSDCYPVVGRAATQGLQRFDARKLKELGCSAVRTNGIASKYFIDECDRIGLLVIEDMYGDGYIGNADFKDALVAMVDAFVRRDRNSPSVIAWGVRVNDSADCDELYFKTGKAAREADPTRSTLGARCFFSSRLYEDVFAYNDYGELAKASPPKGMARLLPYIISEHTGKLLPVRRFDNLALKRKQALAHAAVLNKTYKAKRIAGAIGMSMSDFPMNSGTAYYGVTDSCRADKPAAYLYRSQRENAPYLRADCGFSDEADGRLTVYTNCDAVRLYRDGALVREFYPDRKKYPFLPHPPVEIDDLVGELPLQNGEFSGRQAGILKALVKQTVKRGSVLSLPLWAKLCVFFLAKMKKMSVQELNALITAYAFKRSDYRLEGVSDSQTVIASQVTPSSEAVKITLSASEYEIRPSSSYETVLVCVTATDDVGNTIDYDFSPISVRVEGELQLLGRDLISLSGGTAGFYLTTTPYDGKARVIVASEYGEETLGLEVIHERVERL